MIDVIKCWLDAIEPTVSDTIPNGNRDEFVNSPYELIMQDNRIEGLPEDKQPLRIKDWTYLQKYPGGSLEVLTIVIFWRDFLGLSSKEIPSKTASNSEVRRWIKNGSIMINNERPRKLDDIIQFPVTQLSFFGTGKKKGKITLI